MHTPERSTERKRAGNLATGAAIVTLLLLLILWPVFAPYGLVALLPAVVAAFVYFFWRVITGDLTRDTVRRYLIRTWIKLGE